MLLLAATSFAASNATVAPTLANLQPSSCPAIFVLVSAGRSGSTVIADALEKLTQSEGATLKTELFGSDSKDMYQLAHPLLKMVGWLRAKCDRAAGLIGFKLKPYFELDASGQFADPKWGAVMAWLHDHNASVVYSHRNPLDTLISGKTDEMLNKGGIHQAHCQPSDKACIKAHQVFVTLKEGELLKKDLARSIATQSRLVAMFRRYGIRYMHVTYEQLFSAPEEMQLALWRNMTQFLQPHRTVSVSMSALTKARSSTIRVGAPHQEDRVLNYGKVVATLNGTAFQNLLH